MLVEMTRRRRRSRIKLLEIVTVEGKRWDRVPAGRFPASGVVHLANKSRNVGPEQSHDT
jgi:hypothetical protein